MTDRPQRGSIGSRTVGPQSRRRMRRPPGSRPQRPRRWLGVAGYGGLAAICLCLAAVAFLLVAPPLDAVRDRLIGQVNARTGHTLVVAGPASLSLYPRTIISLSDVALLPPGSEGGAPVATVPSLDIEVSLWSLLLRRPQVGRLTLHRPAIDLTVDAQGRRNWEFSSATRKRALAGGSDGAGPPVPGKQSPSTRRVAAAERLGRGSVRVIDATVRYRDKRAGTLYEVGSLDLVLAEGPDTIDGELAWRGVDVGFSASREILAGQPARLSLKASGAPIDAAYEGTLAVRGGIAADGRVSIKLASLRALRDWLGGAAWPAASGPDALALSAHVTASDDQLALSSLEASLGDVALAGSLAVSIEGRPKVSGKLRVSELDFSKLLVPREKRAVIAPPASTSPAAVPQPDGRARRRGWSEEAIDPRRLARADADLALTVGRLVYKEIKTGQGRLSLAVRDGLAKVVLEDVELYGGRGQGNLTLDGTGSTLALATDLKLAGVAVKALLSDAAGAAWLDGRGTVTLALSGHGLSERQIVEGLSGKVDVAIADGAMTGVDVGKIMRNLQRGRLANLSPAPEDRTPFSELTGTFDIASGTARSRDLRLVSPHLQLKGEGAIELGPRRIDYTLHAKIAGGPPADGAAVRIGTLEIPIGIKGPLERPAFTIMGQEAFADTLKQIGKNLRSPEVQDAIKGLLSGDREKRVDPRDLIEKLLQKP